jgi:hypothetical protein
MCVDLPVKSWVNFLGSNSVVLIYSRCPSPARACWSFFGHHPVPRRCVMVILFLALCHHHWLITNKLLSTVVNTLMIRIKHVVLDSVWLEQLCREIHVHLNTARQVTLLFLTPTAHSLGPCVRRHNLAARWKQTLRHPEYQIMSARFFKQSKSWVPLNSFVFVHFSLILNSW